MTVPPYNHKEPCDDPECCPPGGGVDCWAWEDWDGGKLVITNIGAIMFRNVTTTSATVDERYVEPSAAAWRQIAEVALEIARHLDEAEAELRAEENDPTAIIDVSAGKHIAE